MKSMSKTDEKIENIEQMLKTFIIDSSKRFQETDKKLGYMKDTLDSHDKELKEISRKSDVMSSILDSHDKELKEINRKSDILMEQVSSLTIKDKVNEETELFHTAKIGDLDIRLTNVERKLHKKGI